MPRIEIETGPLLFTFETFDGWVRTGHARFQEHNVLRGETLCVDAKGRLCPTGREMTRARREGTFPVRVYRQAE